MNRPKQLFDLVEVVWDDAAAHDNEWTNVVQVVPQLVLSVGFVVYAKRDYLVIAQDADDEGEHNGRTQIPRGMVRSMKILRKKDKL